MEIDRNLQILGPLVELLKFFYPSFLANKDVYHMFKILQGPLYHVYKSQTMRGTLHASA